MKKSLFKKISLLLCGTFLLTNIMGSSFVYANPTGSDAPGTSTSAASELDEDAVQHLLAVKVPVWQKSIMKFYIYLCNIIGVNVEDIRRSADFIEAKNSGKINSNSQEILWSVNHNKKLKENDMMVDFAYYVLGVEEFVYKNKGVEPVFDKTKTPDEFFRMYFFGWFGGFKERYRVEFDWHEIMSLEI